MSITISDELIRSALVEVLREEVAKLDLESIKCVDAKQGAELFSVTPQAFRKVAADTFDLGQRTARWSIKELREILEKRRVKAWKKR